MTCTLTSKQQMLPRVQLKLLVVLKHQITMLCADKCV